MYWSDGQLAAVDAALASADAGTPTTLIVEGAAGTGKSTLLDEIVERTERFRTFVARSYESAVARPYDVLSTIGVDAFDAESGRPLSPTLVAQRLRTVIDDLGDGGAVVIVVDDLQWADTESVDALVALMSRAEGDRLLLVVGSRPLEPGQLDGWRRWAARPGHAQRLELAGLARDDAVSLVRELAPRTSRDVATRLWEHTAGNPLYLRTLVTDYDATQLAALRVLPAPAEFAHSVRVRLDAVSSDARRIADSLAVLGSGWSTSPDLASLAGVDHPSAGIQELVVAQLAVVRWSDAGDQVRPAHSLVQAAIYQGLSVDTRRDLHARAAAIVGGRGAALDHRAAAVERYDDDLAADLEAYAGTWHDRRWFRHAAHYLRASSAVSSVPVERERRWLEALFESLMSGDRDTARAAIGRLAQATDTRRAGLIHGYLALEERRPIEAARILAALSGSGATDLVQYRIEALLAWCRLNAGAPEAEIQTALDRASGCEEIDPAVSRLAMLAVGQVVARHASDPIEIPGLADLPELPAAAPAEATSRLAWRGLVRTNTGHFAAAAADLNEVTDRMQRGLQEFSSGAFHASLARAQWFSGDWARARMNFHLADDLCADYPHPHVLATRSLPAIGDGEFAAADRAIAAAHELLALGPWVEAIDTLTVIEVIRQHAGVPSGAAYLSIRPTLRVVRDGKVRKSVVWLMHAALAAVWAGELHDARACAQMIEDTAGRNDWAVPVAGWLRGLAAESDGDGKTALTELRHATGAGLAAMPLYAAHLHVDHARLAHLMGDIAAADRSLELAAQTYQALGAAPYLDRINEIRRTTSSMSRAESLSLSDRERDVLTLVTAGMSYAQIARDLFITQSTVSYHLGNIYAKANVSSRHELTALVREQPASFGLATS